VDVGTVPDERDIGIHQGMKAPGWIAAHGGQRGGGLVCRGLEAGSSDRGQERALVTEVNIGRLVADSDGVGNAAEAQRFRGLVDQQPECGLDQLILELPAGDARDLGGGIRILHVDSVNLTCAECQLTLSTHRYEAGMADIGERRTIETRVGPLAVRVRGQGPSVVLWHSLFVDERSWGRVEDELAAGRRLVIINGPGHGPSGDPGRRYTLDDCAEAAATVLDGLGIEEPVDWVGNAWGGHVALVFAAKWPERCRTLVTFGNPIQALRRVERARTISLLMAHRLLGPVGFIRKGVVDTMLSARTRAQDPAAIALLDEFLIHAKRGPLRNAIVSISLDRPDLTSLLATISVPTLLVTGTDHKGWSPEQATAASKLLPNGSAATVAGTSYLVPFEDPAMSIELVRKFWVDHGSPVGAEPAASMVA
jgi:pimeloyl-ACP methyl ester carboxylesterase